MKQKLKILLLTIIAVICIGGAASAELTERLDAIVGAQTQANVRIAVQVVNPETGTIVYSRNASMPMVPASNMKIITTAAALKYLGPDFFYQTRVGLVGESLAVIGSGDPVLGDKQTAEKNFFDPRWMLKDIAQQLFTADITTITDIIVDSTVFDDERVHPSWSKDELNRWYACEVSGLNYNGNCVEIIAETIGSKVQLTLDPPTAYVTIINKCTPTLNPPNTVWGAREANSNVITVLGSCYRQCQPIRVTIDRPPAFLGFLLAEELKRAGVSVRGHLLEKEITASDKLRTIAVYRSSLWDVLERCNKDSLGLAAEALVKTVAASKQPNGKGGSWQAGRGLNSGYLLSLGIPTDQFYIDDGSGLSEKNLLSAHAISTVLCDLYKNASWPNYKKTLAVGGMDGTIDKYFNEPAYKGKIFGKTGYIEGVKSFSGVCTTGGGERIFSIITNKANGNTRQAINDVVKAIIDETQ
ncbi:MAG: D-alanyl-D-alanine carboxypeptidase/D-alanyl-D-alanine-endopeptidase [Sedimentisphaerales bacterium]|nr:D-alanyl-D-alanine carboxypeptidase/D-alanyl-D-alanine-endopeptidase [Sedimentisphaerales bacterium]